MVENTSHVNHDAEVLHSECTHGCDTNTHTHTHLRTRAQPTEYSEVSVISELEHELS